MEGRRCEREEVLAEKIEGLGMAETDPRESKEVF